MRFLTSDVMTISCNVHEKIVNIGHCTPPLAPVKGGVFEVPKEP